MQESALFYIVHPPHIPQSGIVPSRLDVSDGGVSYSRQHLYASTQCFSIHQKKFRRLRRLAAAFRRAASETADCGCKEDP